MTPYYALIKRDLRLSLFRGGEAMTTLFFFLVTASLFPLVLDGDPLLIWRTAVGILWVTALLASLLSLESIYHRDEEDGTFDLLLLSPASPFGIAMAKMLAHWVVAGLPLLIASLALAPMLFIEVETLAVLMPSLFLGTVYMSLLGGMGAILTLGTRRPGLLLALVVLPLYIPMLLLGMMAVSAVTAKPYLLLQLALVIGALPLASLVAGAVLRMNVRA